MSLRNIDFWYWSRYFIDLYKDCPYSCIYCSTRKDASFTGITFIPGLPEEKEVIGLGLLSDIYHPDSQQNISLSNILELLNKRGYPVNILTKSDKILSNCDELKKFSEKARLRVTFTILTLDDELSTKLEGRAPKPSERLETLRMLRKADIPAGVAITPIIPHINDDETSLSKLVRESKRMGASWVLFSGFNPNASFLEYPLFNKLSSIYTDEEKLNKRYKKIKSFMVKILKEENLPIRIPRITLGLSSKKYYSHSISEYLFNISYLHELLGHELEMKRYRRVAYDINNMNMPLKSLAAKKKLGYIKGVNPEIEKVIEEVVYSGVSNFYTYLFKKVTSEV